MIKMLKDIDYTYTQNRELSWLEFNRRVLMEATSENVPLYERLKFVSIFTSNLKEFFMIRVGSLNDLCLLSEPVFDNKTGLSPQEQLDLIFSETLDFYTLRDQIYFDLNKKFRRKGIYNLSVDELSREEELQVYEYFSDFIFPILSPQIIDVHHPFPFLPNNRQYIVVELKDKTKNKRVFGLVQVPETLEPLYKIKNTEKDEHRYILTEKIIYHYINGLFNMYDVISKGIISVTRNADLSGDDEEVAEDDYDYVSHMQDILKKRKRLHPVCLEFKYNINSNIIDFLCSSLDISEKQVFKTIAPINMDYVFDLKNHTNEKLIKELSFEPFYPQKSENINPNKSLIPQIFKKDILLSYPYHDINQFIDLIKEASIDKNVLSIKITIYRLSKNSHLVKYLTRAAENGKKVTIFLELRARFDEQNNIDWSDVLINAGCTVMYGIENYKVHSKLCLITFKDKNQLKYITQIGTGNYNESTSKIYSDLSLMTSDYEIGLDAVKFFNDIAISNLRGKYKHLTASPYTLRKSILDLIDEEIEKGSDGRLIFKMNGLTDRGIINKLSDASKAGVDVDMIIRGITCLLPGIEGETDKIHIRSIVGRFLEHARIYVFGKDEDIKIYLSSADLMTRNTKRRVEVAVPIYDKEIKNQILHFLDIQLKDNVKARKINSNGKMELIPVDEGTPLLNSQEYFMQEAIKAGKNIETKKKKKEKNKILKNLKNPTKKEKKSNKNKTKNQEQTLKEKVKDFFNF